MGVAAGCATAFVTACATACVTACVTAWLVALAAYDVRQRRLPNFLTLPGAALVLVIAAAYGRGAPALFGALALVTVYLAVHLVAPTGMGAGDVKLALGIGALTGAFGLGAWTLAAVVAPAITAVCAIVARGPDRSVPHGPSMCLTAAIAVALAAAAA